MVPRLNRGLVSPPGDENVALCNKEYPRSLAWCFAYRLIGTESATADLELICWSRISDSTGDGIPSEDDDWVRPVADNIEDGSEVLKLRGQARSDDIVRVSHALDDVAAHIGVERSWGYVDALPFLKVNSLKEEHR